jgi:hypothetical protein
MFRRQPQVPAIDAGCHAVHHRRSFAEAHNEGGVRRVTTNTWQLNQSVGVAGHSPTALNFSRHGAKG